MKRFFLLISFLTAISLANPVKAQFLPPISFNNFFKIASAGDLQGLKNAQRRGLNINSMNSGGDTAICVAIKQKNYLAYRTLLRAGAKQNPDCIEKIPEYSHKAFLNNYNNKYGSQKAYLSPNKKWQSFLIGAGVAGGVGIALAGGGGGGSSGGKSDVSTPSYDDAGDKEKCELNRCAEGCYTDMTCETGEYCKQYNDCGGCEQCEKLNQCLVNECAEGCYKNITCPTGQKCSKTNNCNGCEECEIIPVCNTAQRCNYPECYTNLDIPTGYKCTKYNDCGGCEQYAPINGCDVVEDKTYNPISHHCSKYYETCNFKCQEIAENQSYEVRPFEQCSDGYLINIDGIDKCFQKEIIGNECSLNTNFQECESGYLDEETGKCYSCQTTKLPIPCKPYQTCDIGWKDSDENCYKCVDSQAPDICDDRVEQCKPDYWDDETDTCYECEIKDNICTPKTWQECETGYEDDNGDCHRCVDSQAPQTCSDGQSCAAGFWDDETDTCYLCINTTSAANDDTITSSNAFKQGISISVKETNNSSKNVDIDVVGFMANDGNGNTNCENCQNMQVYNAKSNNASISLENQANVIGLHSHQNAYNASGGHTGQINIDGATEYVFGIYANGNAYNATGENSSGHITINVGSQSGGYIYGMYSHDGKAINSNASQATITIINEYQAQKEIFGIFNGSMSINDGEGIIEITDTKGSENIYGIYNGDMKGANDSITITATKGDNVQKIVGLYKNNTEVTKGTITITNNGNTSFGDQVIGIELTDNSSTAINNDNKIEIKGGLYTTTGLVSSAKTTTTPEIDIYNILSSVNSIYGVNNTLAQASDGTFLQINQNITINTNNNNIEKLMGVNTNNPNIKLAKDKSISIEHTDTSSNTNQSVYGIKYENSNNSNYLKLATEGTGKISMTLRVGKETTSIYGIYLEGTNTLTQAQNTYNSIPVEITNSGNKNSNIYGLYLNNIDNSVAATEAFQNRGVIKSPGIGIGITNANIKNTASISASSMGITATGGSITNTGEIKGFNGNVEYGIKGTNTRIDNQGTITASQYGIYANATDTSTSSSLSNTGDITLSGSNGYGIWATNYDSINHDTGKISGGYHGIHAENVNSISITGGGEINATHVGIYSIAENSNNITVDGKIGDTTSPKVGIYTNKGDVTINTNASVNATTIGIYTDGGNVTNSGTIKVSGSGTEMYGILGLNSGGGRTTITNTTSGTIDIRSSYSGLSDVKMFGIYAGDGVDVVNSGTIEVKSTGSSIGSGSIVGGIYLAKGSTLNNSGHIKMSKTDQTKGLSVGIITASKLPYLQAVHGMIDSNNYYQYDDKVLITNEGTINDIYNIGLINEGAYNLLTTSGTWYNMLSSQANDLKEGNVVAKIWVYAYRNEISYLAQLNFNDKVIDSLILEQTEIDPSIDISSLIQAQGASISTTGLFETDMPLTLSTLGLRKFGVGKNGTIEAPSISGEVTAETSIVEDGFETTYTNEESFIGDTSGVNIVSESALFNAKLVEKDNNTTDIVMTMKPFEEVVENESVAQYLQNNYTHKNNEKLFSQLKSFESSAEINSHLNKELGLSLLPNFAQENLQIFRSLNGLIIDDIFSKNLTDERMLVGYDYMSQDRNSKGHITGYDNHANSSYFLADIKLDKNSRFGAGMSITKFDSDYDDNSSRDETFVSALASYMYEFNPNLKYAGVARLGYGFGDYDRNTSDNSYKANLHDLVYGLGNQLRYAYNMKYFTLEPQVEFNILGYYQRNMKEQIKNNSLHVASTNNLSVETGVGLYASKSAKFNEWTNLKARLGAGYYRELADPYHDMKVSLRDMNGYYKTDASPIFDRNRYLLNADVNLDYRQFNFYLRANWFIENDDTAIINAGIKYNF